MFSPASTSSRASAIGVAASKSFPRPMGGSAPSKRVTLAFISPNSQIRTAATSQLFRRKHASLTVNPTWSNKSTTLSTATRAIQCENLKSSMAKLEKLGINDYCNKEVVTTTVSTGNGNTTSKVAVKGAKNTDFSNVCCSSDPSMHQYDPKMMDLDALVRITTPEVCQMELERRGRVLFPDLLTGGASSSFSPEQTDGTHQGGTSQDHNKNAKEVLISDVARTKSEALEVSQLRMYMRSEYDRHVSEVVEKLVKPRDAAFRRNTFWRDFSPALPVLGAVAAVGYVCSTACRLCSKAFWQGEKSGAKKTGESRWCQATGDYPLAVATL